MSKRIRFGDWNAVTDELRRFAEGGDVTTGDDWIRIDFGSAQVEASQNGYVSTAMQLHDFERDGADDLVVDHDAGSLTIDTDDATYTFRRPGG